jgi:hypothetical protein
MNRITVLMLFLWIGFSLQAQENSKNTDFRSPVDFNITLSGTFGELRSNHLHAGIDIKTYGAINKPLYAIADGFVSRVVVSPGGYGKAVYIEHPNGYTSVYAHCNKFTGELADWVKNEQYRLESFQVNLFPEPGQFKVKKGEIVAYSGNSGSSMGPHLHFEIRKTAGQIPVNPLQFKFKVKDFVRPKIAGMRIYPATSYSEINDKNKIFEPVLAGWGPDYRIKENDTIRLSGEFYFGIKTYDKLNESNNHNGVYAIQLYIDSALVYYHSMDEFAFSETRYTNSLIDFSAYINKKGRYQKTYIEPNNKLSVYQTVENNGVFLFIDDNYHTIKYVVKDFFGNESILTFTVKSSPPGFSDVFDSTTGNSNEEIFSWDKDNTFKTSDFEIEIPAGALYDTLAFVYEKTAGSGDYFSEIHKVHREGKAIHRSCEIRIRPTDIPLELKDKAVVVKIEDDEMSYAGGEWSGDFLSTSIRTFGDYAVAADTTAPMIKPLNFSDGEVITTQTKLKLKIDDDLAGIDNITATLNGAWLLMDWDPKNNLLVYEIDERLKPGKNEFMLEVVDGVNNKTSFSATITK